MKHPASQHLATNSQPGSAIPWSAEAEFHLRRRITTIWFSMWSLFLAGLGMLLIGWFASSTALAISGIAVFFAGIFFLNALNVARQNLGEEMRRGPRGEFFAGSGMLANKPRSTQRLTQWIQHNVREERFYCAHADGRATEFFSWKDAQWIANYDTELMGEAEYPSDVDPGGGRFVILCPCGIGHFKLKLLTEQDIVDRGSAPCICGTVFEINGACEAKVHKGRSSR